DALDQYAAIGADSPDLRAAILRQGTTLSRRLPARERRAYLARGAELAGASATKLPRRHAAAARPPGARPPPRPRPPPGPRAPLRRPVRLPPPRAPDGAAGPEPGRLRRLLVSRLRVQPARDPRPRARAGAGPARRLDRQSRGRRHGAGRRRARPPGHRGVLR